MTPRHRTDLVARLLEDETLILDSVAGRIHQLNATAGLIWQSCDGSRSVPDIVALVAEQFAETPQRVLPDVLDALRELEERGLLATQP